MIQNCGNTLRHLVLLNENHHWWWCAESTMLSITIQTWTRSSHSSQRTIVLWIPVPDVQYPSTWSMLYIPARRVLVREQVEEEVSYYLRHRTHWLYVSGVMFIGVEGAGIYLMTNETVRPQTWTTMDGCSTACSSRSILHSICSVLIFLFFKLTKNNSSGGNLNI